MTRLLKVSEAAKILGLSRSKMYELTKSNKVPVVYIDSCVRIPENMLNDWIEKRVNASS